MKTTRPVGLVSSGRISSSPASKLAGLRERLGPVMAPTFHQASRIANYFRSGFAVREYEAFEECRLVVLAAPWPHRARLIAELQSAGLSWRHRAAVICGMWLDSRELEPLLQEGAAVGSVTPIEGFDGARYLVEGDRMAVREIKHLVEAGRGRALEVRPRAKPLCSAAATMAAGMLVPLLDAAVQSLRAAGLTPGEAGPIAERLFQRSIRSYLKGGRKNWKGILPARDQAALAREFASLKEASPELARYYLDLAVASLRLYGRDAAWLREFQPAAKAAPY